MNKINVELSSEEINYLTCYILMTTNYRKDEVEAWERLAEEKETDGSPKFPKAQKNADYYREFSEKLETIREKLDSAWINA